jgi:DNA primase catalytic core
MSVSIPQETIDRIKREVSVAELARQRGVDLKGSGDNLLGLCPFHEDHEPSLVITPSKNLWNCLGACGKGGDAIRWVETAEHVPFLRAVELLSRGYPNFSYPHKRGARASTPSRPCPITLDMNERELVEAVVKYYEESLTRERNPEAMKFLERRGINDPEAIARFRIGFSDRSLGPLLPDVDHKPGKMLRERLAQAGLYRVDSGHEHFRGCVVFPIAGKDGEVTEIYGRKIRDDMRHRVGRHLYLPGPHRGIWNAEALNDTKDLIVCEAIIDALTFWVHGFRNVIAAYGVDGFTDEMFEAVKACGIERVMIAYDRDDAGAQGAEQLAARLAPEGIACYRVLFPRHMDANDYARRVQPAAQALGLALRSAEQMRGTKSRTGAIAVTGLVPSSVIPQPRHAEQVNLPAVVESPILPEVLATESRGAIIEHDEANEDIEEDELPPLVVKPRELQPIDNPTPPAPPASQSTGQPFDYSDITVRREDREYRIRGLEKNLS